MAQERGSEQEKEDKGKMTVQEAGHKGGQRVRELTEEGKEQEGEQGAGPSQEETGKTKKH